MNKFESASILAGMSPNEEAQVSEPTNLHVITGEVVSRSEDGTVMVSMDGLVFSEDDTQYIEMDTIGGLEEGDDATIILAGENGSAMSPFVFGSAGSVDRVRDTAETAQTIADAAQAVAEATNQHFFDDDNGIHVTESTQDDWNENHEGANVLINARGQLFRDGLNNLLALLPQKKQTYNETVVQNVDNQLILMHPPTKMIKVLFTDGDPTHDYELDESQYSVSGNVITVVFSGEGATYEVTYSVGETAVAIFDGLGDEAENVVARFTEYEHTIGYENNKHVTIDEDSIDMCNGSDVLWSMRSAYNGAPLITTEKDGYYVGSYADGDGTEAPRQSSIQGLIGFLRDYGDGAATFVSASAQYSNALKDAEITLFSPSASSAATESRAVIVADRLSLLIDRLTVSGSTFDASHVADMLTTSSETLTRGSAVSSWSSGTIRKSGKVVTMTINGAKLASALSSGSTSGTITTIPTGYRPTDNLQRGVACIGTTGNYANVWFVVSTTGNVAIANRSSLQIPTTAEISMQITYIID